MDEKKFRHATTLLLPWSHEECLDSIAVEFKNRQTYNYQTNVIKDMHARATGNANNDTHPQIFARTHLHEKPSLQFNIQLPVKRWRKINKNIDKNRIENKNR